MNFSFTDRQRDLLLHALGRPWHQAVNPYRNNFATDPCDPEWDTMVGLGMAKHGSSIPGGLCYYHVTDEAQRAVLATLPKFRKYEIRVRNFDGPSVVWAGSRSKAKAEVISNLRECGYCETFKTGAEMIESVRLA